MGSHALIVAIADKFVITTLIFKSLGSKPGEPQVQLPNEQNL